MPRRAATTVGLALALLAPFVTPAGAATPPPISLALTPKSITYGASQTASGAIDGDATCAAGRAVDLEQRPVGSTTWTVLDTATSGGDGSFSFAAQQPEATASYRARAVAGLTCAELVSKPVKGAVAADVTLSLGRTRIPAGECGKATITVQPDKHGQQVLLQERGSSGWRTLRTLTLDGSSSATTKLCEDWADLGAHTERGRWVSQDTSNATANSDPVAMSVVEAGWMQRIDHLTAGRAAGVSVRSGGRLLYERAASTAFAPASNEKLVLSMALLNRFDPDLRIETDAAARRLDNGVVRGDLWILGHGDPSVGPVKLGGLARALAAEGVRRITGRVMGSTTYFAHDWFAPGWKPDFPKDEIPLPSALTFRGNHVKGRNVSDPERYAARALTQRLEARGIAVAGTPSSGAAPGGLVRLASVTSSRLEGLMRHMDHDSDNFYAEVLGKALAAASAGPPGTIAHAAGVISAWARAHGAAITANDSSGLSYRDRLTADGMTRMLQAAENAPWGDTLRDLLPAAGQGTLEDRLAGVKLRAKTGTLDNISALSGWVWLKGPGTWAQFSILDRGMSYSTEKSLEDAIVRTFFNSAR